MHAKNVYLRGWLPWLGLCLVTAGAHAATLQRAEITRLLNEVLVLKPGEKPEQAKVSEVITGETAVRTGAKSRAELEFSDKTLTRLGANSLFSFTQGTRDMSLEEGTMLLQVPKDAGGAKIRTAAVTAAITGTTVMIEHSKGNHSKLIVIEGTMRVYLPGKMGESILLKPGQMLILPPNATRLPNPVRVDLKKLVRTSRLMNTKDFEEIPSEDLIKQEVATQQQELKDGKLVNTNIVLLGRGTEVVIATEDMLTAIENATNAEELFLPVPDDGPGPGPNPTPQPPNPTPTPNPTPRPPPVVKYQPITTIPGTPYVINSSTEVVTDPTITTNGKKDNGTLYNSKVQGKPSTFFFGETTTFERKTGFDETLAGAGDVGVFEFTGLEFRGSPKFITTNGPKNVAFLSRNNITSSGNGFTLDFSQLDEMYLMTHAGSITLGEGIHEIIGPNQLFLLYARGAGGTITLNAPLSMNNGIVGLYAENSVLLNSTIKAKGIDIITGNSLHLTGLLQSPLISILARENVSLSASYLDIPTLEQLLVQAKSLNLNGNFSLSSDPIVVGDKGGFSSASAEAVKGALFEIGIGGVTGSPNLILHGSINIISQGPIDFSAPGTVIDIDGVVESQSSIKFWGDSVVGSASAKNFIRLEGGATDLTLASNNGAIITKVFDNGSSDGGAYISSPSLIEYTTLMGGGFHMDAPKILRHGKSLSSEIPYLGTSVEVLEFDGNLTFDSNFFEDVTVRLRPGFSIDSTSSGSISVDRLVTQGAGGNAALADMSLQANVVNIGGNFKILNAPLDTNALHVGGNFNFTSSIDVQNVFAVQGGWIDNDPVPGTRTLVLGPSASQNIVLAGGVDLQPKPTAVHADGASIQIFADEGFRIGQGGFGGAGLATPQINLRGQDLAGSPNSGGDFTVNISSAAAKPLIVKGVFISTEPGATGSPNGQSGSVDIFHNGTSDPGETRIQIGNSKIVTNTTGSRNISGSTGSIGNIKIESKGQTGKGICIADSSQLLALTMAATPGGDIALLTSGAAIEVLNSTIDGKNVRLDTQNAGVDGIVNLTGATLSAQDVLKVRAYGNGGQLTISNNSVLSAGNQMKLYGGFTNGKVFFTGGGNISVNAPNVHIAANLVEVSSGTNVNNSTGNVNVYANGPGNHKYNVGGFGNINAAGSLNQSNSTTAAPGF